MAHEYNPDPWRHTDRYIDRTYPSGVAQERPMLTTRIHCEPEAETTMREAMLHGPNYERGKELAEQFGYQEPILETESQTAKFNRELRGGHAGRNDRER